LKNPLGAHLALALLAVAFLAGCSSSSGDDATVKAGSGEVTNPGGKPRNDQEAAIAGQMQQAGNAMNDQRAKAAAAEQAARAAAGGK